MTLVEPASSLTDIALGVLALFAAARLAARESTDSHWQWFFVWIGIAGIWGGFHHGFIVAHETTAAISWSVISLLVAVAISYLLLASVNSVLGKGRGQGFLIIRAISLVAFLLFVVSGNATVTTLVLTEGVAMAIVVGLWVHAWQKGQPGSGLVLAAIFLSLLAAGFKVSSAQFTLGGWEFDPNSIYHVAQMPGICLMFMAIQRRADAAEEQPPWQHGSVAAVA